MSRPTESHKQRVWTGIDMFLLYMRFTHEEIHIWKKKLYKKTTKEDLLRFAHKLNLRGKKYADCLRVLKEQTGQHGGKRAGSGSPPLPDHLKRKRVLVSLPPWLLDEMVKLSDNRSQLIVDTFIKTYNLKPPK